MFKARKFKDLEKRLGYRFKNQALIERALTHASVKGSKTAREDNERLEFIGDRVLGLAIVEILNEAFPDGERGRAGAPLQPPRQGRDLRQGRPRPRTGNLHGALRKRGRKRRPPQADHPRRRGRGGARRHLSRGGLQQGARRRAPPCGRARASRTPRPPSMPSRLCRNGRKARVSRCRTTSRSSARVPITHHSSPPRCA